MRPSRARATPLRAWLACVCAAAAPAWAQAPDRSAPANPAIDMEAHLRLSREAAVRRESHRVTEAEFIRMSREPGSVILDARSRARYDELHVRDAVNVPFPDFTAGSLARAISSKDTRVLIYCNNNFVNAEGPFPTKLPAASLNLSTYVTLYIYGYRNVYELAPLLDPRKARIEFESTR